MSSPEDELLLKGTLWVACGQEGNGTAMKMPMDWTPNCLAFRLAGSGGSCLLKGAIVYLLWMVAKSISHHLKKPWNDDSPTINKPRVSHGFKVVQDSVQVSKPGDKLNVKFCPWLLWDITRPSNHLPSTRLPLQWQFTPTHSHFFSPVRMCPLEGAPPACCKRETKRTRKTKDTPMFKVNLGYSPSPPSSPSSPSSPASPPSSPSSPPPIPPPPQSQPKWLELGRSQREVRQVSSRPKARRSFHRAKPITGDPLTLNKALREPWVLDSPSQQVVAVRVNNLPAQLTQ